MTGGSLGRSRSPGALEPRCFTLAGGWGVPWARCSRVAGWVVGCCKEDLTLGAWDLAFLRSSAGALEASLVGGVAVRLLL